MGSRSPRFRLFEVLSTGRLTLLDVTLRNGSSASSLAAGAVHVDGGAISNFGGSQATIVYNTFLDNGPASGVALWTADGNVNQFSSNIIAGSSSGGNCSGTLPDVGGNLRWPDTDAICVGTQADPKLQPLADNGGRSRTIAIASDSPAIDNGDDAACTPWPVSSKEQRAYLRPIDGNGDASSKCDSGAFECNPIELVQDGSVAVTYDRWEGGYEPHSTGGTCRYDDLTPGPHTIRVDAFRGPFVDVGS